MGQVIGLLLVRSQKWAFALTLSQGADGSERCDRGNCAASERLYGVGLWITNDAALWRGRLPYLEVIYALVYLILLIAGTAFVVWRELALRAAAHNHSVADSVYAIIVDVGYVGIADAAVTFGVVEEARR